MNTVQHREGSEKKQSTKGPMNTSQELQTSSFGSDTPRQKAEKGVLGARVDKRSTEKSAHVTDFATQESGKAVSAARNGHRPHKGGRRRKIAGDKPAGSIETSYSAQDSQSSGPSQVFSSQQVTGSPSLSATKPNQFQPGNKFAWRPGETGNPAGRPRTGVFSEAVKAILDETDPKLQKTEAQRILMEQAYRRARQGSIRHLELLIAYAEGRPKQGIELETKVNYHDALVKAKERLREHQQSELERLTPEEREALSKLKTKMLPPALPASSGEPEKTNGHASAETVEAAISAVVEGEEGRDPATPRPKQRIRVEL